MYIRFTRAANDGRLGGPKARSIILNTLVFGLPILVGKIVSYCPLARTGLVFLRSNCDHFGSWMQVFQVIAEDVHIKYKQRIVVCAKRMTLISVWEKLLKKRCHNCI